ANAMSSAKQMFLSEGFDGFVSKPIEIEELERTLKRLLPKNAVSYADGKDEEPVTDDSKAAASFEADDDDIFEFGPGEETETENVSVSDDVFAKLNEAGIDTEAGLGYFNGAKDFYMELLIQFNSELTGKIENLNKFYAAEDWPNYEIVIHSTKSSCKMIGENVISDEAYKLEQAAHNKDAGYITSNHERVLTGIAKLKAALDEILGDTKSDLSDDVMEFSPDDDGEVFEFDAGGSDDVIEFNAEEDE
ncbi:MAG: hypothetical protein IIZ48_08450, partial [Erysipelotrichales bacterium]|nr:hypothetical protein [Erysipelotrichales bacterium]